MTNKNQTVTVTVGYLDWLTESRERWVAENHKSLLLACKNHDLMVLSGIVNIVQFFVVGALVIVGWIV